MFERPAQMLGQRFEQLPVRRVEHPGRAEVGPEHAGGPARGSDAERREAAEPARHRRRGATWVAEAERPRAFFVAAPRWRSSAAMRYSCSTSVAGSPSEATIAEVLRHGVEHAHAAAIGVQAPHDAESGSPGTSASASFGWFR